MNLHETARANMIENQLRPNKVTDERVIGAFARLRRELFVPERMRGVAYIDEDLPLGGGRYLMQPMVVARLLQTAAVEAKATALVVGAGVGYEAALLAFLARSVIALEDNAELARFGRSALVEHGIASVSYVEAPLAAGYRQKAPYDVILFGGAVAEIPEEIGVQLGEGGRMMAVLRPPETGPGRATLVVRTGGVLAYRAIFDAATPLLPGFVPTPAFVF
jgi:protein-L-isoaspartate(D-aspartate) O-methyltransferase